MCDIFSNKNKVKIRIFSPIILFNDSTADICSDSQVIELKKQKVDAMLKTNVQFWNSIIYNHHHQKNLSPPETPPPSTIYNNSPSPYYSSSCSSATTTTTKWNQKRQSEEDKDNDDRMIQDAHKNKKLKTKATTTNAGAAATTTTAAAATTTTTTVVTTSHHGRKRRGNLPKNVTAILKQWLIEHSRHPYPTEEEKRGLRLKTNLTLNQISNWFINARRRILPLILSSPYQQEENNPHSLRKKSRRKRGWITNHATTDSKHIKQLCPIVKERDELP
ncbi:uncharacterized protein BX663DRAFT_545534 [Cokeromyces recurvatus]|uniref:uncharacterized protein n=1 Tax=Cokeromyces recurvatus TaxID=90255 RepID=UPI00221FA41B|nr:uncharacterized protein BX663DRAFT_545534 [Cokeromyces recurvatus]KAI7899623.1 hypothetical protein BX663DRAFT_545534 [Cokeromyces recurvatus]